MLGIVRVQLQSSGELHLDLNLQDTGSAIHDAPRVARETLDFPRGRYLERRRLRGESLQFGNAWAKASFIGGFLRRPEAELLFEFAAAVPAERDIVEIGSYLGRSAAFLALGAGPGRMVHAIDHHAHSLDTWKLLHVHMQELGLADRVEAHHAISVVAARSYRGKPIGLLFVDAEHTEKAVYEDGREWAAQLAPGGFVLFDDINLPGVARGVGRLVADGVLPEIAGHVGKIGVAGPVAAWPDRVRVIARNA